MDKITEPSGHFSTRRAISLARRVPSEVEGKGLKGSSEILRPLPLRYAQGQGLQDEGSKSTKNSPTSQITIDFKSFLPVVKEFVKALKQKQTYSIRKNWYCIFGILWGMPVPIVTIGIDLYSANLALTIFNIAERIIYHPIQLFFLLHPLFFGIVFGAMGTVRYAKERKIREFETNLIGKNKELELAFKKLQELDKLKANFLSMVSHELRTPLTTIQGYTAFLRSEGAGNLNQAQKEYLKISQEEGELLNHFIEELLDLSKIERAEFKINLENVDMREAISKSIASLQLLADNQGVIIKNSLSNDLPSVLADREKIFQVVTNLLENGIKFNRRGGEINICASYHGQDNKVIFCVSDTGIGIQEDKLNRIFDKFYQGSSCHNQRYGGCGLGLAITKSILDLHQGRIWVESKIDVGSKFFFELNAPTIES